MKTMRATCTAFLLLVCAVSGVAEEQPGTNTGWNPRSQFLRSLVEHVPGILKSQDRKTGRFGDAPWCCTDQNVLYPLAAAWATNDKSNPYYHSPDVLEAIMAGGDALIANQDKDGMWTFRKKDNSTWGQILMPWTYSRWIRAFALIKDAMPAERRTHWENGLTLGFTKLAPRLPPGQVHNILSHHAMALYCAGLCFNREDWKKIAREVMARVVAAQNPGGWWSEHSGPVVAYNFVYVEALGVYYAMSRDMGVLEALRRAAGFHATFAYPNGTLVETVDERNPYEAGTAHGNVGFNFTPVEGNAGFSFTPEGRGFLHRQYTLRKWSVTADEAASHLLYGESGPAAPPVAESDEYLTVVGNNEALVLRRNPWFICLSAFTCEQPVSRWQQDRQNFVSIYHDRTGLIIGGGNTKLQPFWSNFTVGDTAGLQQRPGDENPDFKPKGGLIHIPSAAKLHAGKDSPSLDLTYGEEQCSITIRPLDENHLTLVCEATSKSGKPVEGHVVLLPCLGADLRTASGKSAKLGVESIEWAAGDIGAWFDYGAIHVSVPPGAKLVWPKKRHNPYKRDGRSTLGEARLVLCLPFSPVASKHEVSIELANCGDPR